MLLRAPATQGGSLKAAVPNICRLGSRAVVAQRVVVAAQPDGVPPPPPSGSPSQGSPAVVQIEYRGRRLQAPSGATLRTAMLQAGVTPHNGRAELINCRGLGTCGTCAVEVRGPVEPQEWSTQERLRLNFPPHTAPGNQRLRLACQVACQGDLEVVKRSGFWGQGEEVMAELAPGSSSPSPPLGDLEYILDRRRRT